MMRSLYTAILLGTLTTPVVAQDRSEFEVYRRLMTELNFETYISTPNVLDPAIVPFLDCMLADAGSILLDDEGYPREVTQSEAGCPNERAEARSLGIEILKQEGMTSPELQNALIDEIFRAVELMATTNKSWDGSVRHVALPSSSEAMPRLEGPTTSIAWEVDDQGLMTSCTVTKTSGDPKLDELACAIMEKNRPTQSGETTVLIEDVDLNARNQ